MKVFMEFGKYSRIVVDENGQFWQEFCFPEKFSHSSFMCDYLCGYSLKRVHAGCLVCRLRRVWLDKMPKRIRVSPYIVFKWQDRPHRRMTDKLFSLVASVLEMLASL